jgi:hypothetical protein
MFYLTNNLISYFTNDSKAGVSNSNWLTGCIRQVNNLEVRMKTNLGLLGPHQTSWRAIIITIISLLNLKCNEMRKSNWNFFIFFRKIWANVIFHFFLILISWLRAPLDPLAGRVLEVPDLEGPITKTVLIHWGHNHLLEIRLLETGFLILFQPNP